MKLGIAGTSCDLQYLPVDIKIVRLAVLADEGVDLALSVEIIKQLPHQLGRSSIDGKLTPMVFGASLVDNHQHFMLL
jgi:hypothetical protein